MASRGFAKPGQAVSEVLKSKVSVEYNKWEVKKKNALLITLYFQSTLQTCNLNTFVFENDFEYSPFFSTNVFQFLSSTLDYRRMLQSPTQSIQSTKMPLVQRFNHQTYKGLSKRLYRNELRFEQNVTC